MIEMTARLARARRSRPSPRAFRCQIAARSRWVRARGDRQRLTPRARDSADYRLRGVKCRLCLQKFRSPTPAPHIVRPFVRRGDRTNLQSPSCKAMPRASSTSRPRSTAICVRLESPSHDRYELIFEAPGVPLPSQICGNRIDPCFWPRSAAALGRPQPPRSSFKASTPARRVRSETPSSTLAGSERSRTRFGAAAAREG